MNLKKALKEKNKLKGKITETYERIRRYNIAEEGIARPYDPKQLLNDLFANIDEMVALKTKIQSANIQVFDKIFRLSELKNIAGKLKYMPCEIERIEHVSGKFSTASISTNKRDAIIENIQKKIEQIQEELDEFNYQMKI